MYERSSLVNYANPYAKNLMSSVPLKRPVQEFDKEA